MRNYILICLTSLLSLNCSPEEVQQNYLDLTFNLINQEGIITSEFENGAQPIFNLQIVNNSKEDVFLVSDNLNDENVFEVFSTTQLNENSDPVSFGKPFKNAGCYYIGGYHIKSGDIFSIKLPWIPEENEISNYPSILCNYNFSNDSLRQGVYSTSLDVQFGFQIGKNTVSKAIQKEITFSIN
jgi:hypothetical protein